MDALAIKKVKRTLLKPIEICNIKCDLDYIKNRNSSLFRFIKNELTSNNLKELSYDIVLIRDCMYSKGSNFTYKIPIEYGDIAEYKIVTDLALNRPEKIEFYNGFCLTDFEKLFEITSRGDRKYLDDEQFNALYKAFLGEDEYIPSRSGTWLKDFIGKYNTAEYKDEFGDSKYHGLITDREEEILDGLGLLDEKRILDQTRKVDALGKQKIPFFDEHLEYLGNFVERLENPKAKKITPRLIKSTFLSSNADLFSDIFEYEENKNIIIKF